MDQNFQAPKMCYAQEGYVHSSDSGSLGLEQLKTVFYLLFTTELIGFVIGIVENVVKRVSVSRGSETLGNSSPSFERNNPFLCQRCSSNFVRVLNQANSESDVILEQLRKMILSDNYDIMEETVQNRN